MVERINELDIDINKFLNDEKYKKSKKRDLKLNKLNRPD